MIIGRIAPGMAKIKQNRLTPMNSFRHGLHLIFSFILWTGMVPCPILQYHPLFLTPNLSHFWTALRTFLKSTIVCSWQQRVRNYSMDGCLNTCMNIFFQNSNRQKSPARHHTKPGVDFASIWIWQMSKAPFNYCSAPVTPMAFALLIIQVHSLLTTVKVQENSFHAR